MLPVSSVSAEVSLSFFVICESILFDLQNNNIVFVISSSQAATGEFLKTKARHPKTHMQLLIKELQTKLL